ncbi:endonuclease/exonuclease/phosphatase family protein [Streptomyces brasiliscabiei]|uniref:endonuclease/exonuclease/phosphatase family protein n=1 Tax=Streptomyces brasiliscabiei TaxID=2736302 RepID=UPI001C0FE972|nr:endonuclease/exonuclease/phosphatase family protein [Streptomyces brasiliscabiei]
MPPLSGEFTVQSPESALHYAQRVGEAPVISKPAPGGPCGPMVKFTGAAAPGTDYLLFFENGRYLGGTGVGDTGQWIWRRSVNWPGGEHAIQCVGLRGDGCTPVLDHRFTDTGGETYTGGGRTVEVRRGLLCAHTSFAGRPLVACTAHTNAKAPGQLREIRDRLARLPQEMPVILAGDLNLPPDAPALAHLTGRFAEADEADDEPTADGRKIDYVFADRRHFTVVDGDAEKYAESDHALLTGRFTLTSAST